MHVYVDGYYYDLVKKLPRAKIYAAPTKGRMKLIFTIFPISSILFQMTTSPVLTTTTLMMCPISMACSNKKFTCWPNICSSRCPNWRTILEGNWQLLMLVVEQAGRQSTFCPKSSRPSEWKLSLPFHFYERLIQIRFVDGSFYYSLLSLVCSTRGGVIYQ